MSINIVQVNVSQTVGEAPNRLQQTGCIVSDGATTTAPGTLTLLTQVSSFTGIQQVPRPISTIVWSSGTATVTTVSPHGFAVGDTFAVTIAGTTPSAYSGTWSVTSTGASTFTYVINTNPGSLTVPGTYVNLSASLVLEKVSEFFAQGSNLSIYVLEIGSLNATDGCPYLNTWIQNNPKTIYIWITPAGWDGYSAFINLLNEWASDTALTYFISPTINTTYTNYSSCTAKSAYIQAQYIQTAPFLMESDAAAVSYNMLNYAPSDTNKVAPLCFQFVSDVTPWPVTGSTGGVQNQTLLQLFKNANINYISTAAEGGNSNTMLVWGNMLDGNPFNYWYAVDWVQINLDEDLSNEIINGSNNPINPLYYDQAGINRLQARAQATMQRGITFGMVLGPVTVNAIPFSTYVTNNPEDYTAGIYRGLSVSFTPQRGFTQIVFNLNVTAFPTSST